MDEKDTQSGRVCPEHAQLLTHCMRNHNYFYNDCSRLTLEMRRWSVIMGEEGKEKEKEEKL